MDLMIYIISLLVSFIITVFITPKILLISLKKKILDIPNSRKIHQNISSRLGGVAFFPSLVMTLCVVIATLHLLDASSSQMFASWISLCLGATFLMYMVGIADDIQGVSYRTKFFYQIISSLFIIASGTWINNLYGIFGVYEIPLWIGVPLSSLLVVFIINAINLIDGIDGLSSGLSIIALSFYGLIFFIDGQFAPTIVAIATLGSLLGFFRYNFFGLPHRSTKIFMGDAGTLFVGTIIALLALKLLHFDSGVGCRFKGTTEVLVAYSVLIVPCFDVIRVMLHRLLSHRPLFSPDRNHIHHKIMAMGVSARDTLFVILSFSVLITFINLLLNRLIALEYVMIFDAILWTFINVVLIKKRKA